MHAILPERRGVLVSRITGWHILRVPVVLGPVAPSHARMGPFATQMSYVFVVTSSPRATPSVTVSPAATVPLSTETVKAVEDVTFESQIE